MDHTIASRELQVERKHFSIEFRENERRRFLRITAEATAGAVPSLRRAQA